jgi:hypothetical protein
MIEELRKTSNEQRLIDTRTTKSRIRNKNTNDILQTDYIYNYFLENIHT